MLKHSSKKILWLTIVLPSFLIGLVLSVVIFNKQQRKIENYFEVTFIDSRQAVVFWKTEKETIGFVKYGADKHKLSQISKQTSDVPSNVHAVVLNEIPLEGFYLSLHTEADSLFLWPEIHKISFNPGLIE